MKNNRHQTKANMWVAWIMGLFTFVVIKIVFDVIVVEMGFSTYIDFGRTLTIKHRYYDNELDGAFTSLGLAIIVWSGMIASRVGMAFYSKRVDGNISKKGQIDFLAWFAGVTVFGIQACILSLFEKNLNSTIMLIIEITLTLGIVVVCKKWREKRYFSLSRDES